MTLCCDELKKLAPPYGSGFGLIYGAKKHGPFFLLGYAKDWSARQTEAVGALTMIKFCPYCGADLIKLQESPK
jgi:hypothetical protein